MFKSDLVCCFAFYLSMNFFFAERAIRLSDVSRNVAPVGLAFNPSCKRASHVDPEAERDSEGSETF